MWAAPKGVDWKDTQRSAVRLRLKSFREELEDQVEHEIENAWEAGLTKGCKGMHTR